MKSRDPDSPPAPAQVELTPELVQRLVDRNFQPDDRAAAAKLLESFGAARHEREPVRVRVAALKLCKGQLAELEKLIA